MLLHLYISSQNIYFLNASRGYAPRPPCCSTEEHVMKCDDIDVECVTHAIAY